VNTASRTTPLISTIRPVFVVLFPSSDLVLLRRETRLSVKASRPNESIEGLVVSGS